MRRPPSDRPAAAIPAALALFLCSLASGAVAADPAPAHFVTVPGRVNEAGEPAWAVANEVIVRMDADAAVALQEERALSRRLGGDARWIVPRRRRALAAPNALSAAERMAVLRLPPGVSLEDGLRAASRLPGVAYAEPNLLLRTTAPAASGLADPPNDFEFRRQWSLHNTGQTGGTPGADIGALAAWAVSTGSRDMVVAIIDTGIDYFHPDLATNVWVNPGEIPGNGIDDDLNGYIDDVHGFDFVSGDGDPMDDNLHGTHVAGILGAAGNDQNGIAGVAWNVRMMALKAFNETGGGTLDDTIEAVAYATDAGVRIINASWGTTVLSRALDEVVTEAVRRGVLFIAAAGNHGTDVSFYPAAFPATLAVSASDARDGSPRFANYGPFVDLVAPGDGIHSTAPNASWTLLSGTSMAAPHVSGIATLLLSVNPSFTPAQIASILRSTADEITTDRNTGVGRVNAARAIRISEPLPDAALELPPQLSAIVSIRGEAGGHRFAGYRLELGPGKRPTEWIRLADRDTPGTEGILLDGFDTSAHDDGEYTMRLVVRNDLGQEALVRHAVEIRNVRLAHPENNDILRAGEHVEIRGTVAGEGRTFEFAWGVGPNPAQWHDTGFELRGGGRSPVIESALATWDSSVAPAGEFVTIRVRALREGRSVGEALALMVHLEPRLRPGWPKRLEFTDEFPTTHWREFNVADLTGDGRREVVFVDHGEPSGRSPRLVVLDSDGATVWERELPGGAPEFDAPVIGDIDGDGVPDIVVDTGDAGQILAFDAFGNRRGDPWPVAPGGTHFGKILADLDGDGAMEVIAVSNPPPDLVSHHRRSLVVIDGGGRIVARWQLSGCREETNAPEQLPAVINLDDDPELEIVAVDGCGGVSAFDLSNAAGPVWTAVTDAHFVASPVTGDLDADGREEVILGGVSRGKGRPGGLHVWNRDGQPRAGWPILTSESFHASAALEDIDGDGWLEIIVPSWDSTRLHVVRPDGFELRGWPLRNAAEGTMHSLPVIGDVDGDQWPDVVLPSPGFWLHVVRTGDTARTGGIRAWRFDGSRIDFHPARASDFLAMESTGGSWHHYAPAVLTDLDGNGLLDIVSASPQDGRYSPKAPFSTHKWRSSIYAWELPVPFTADAHPWSSHHGGPARNGRYHRPPPPNQAPIVQSIPDQTIAPGHAFRPVPLDLYVHDPDHPVDRLTWAVEATGPLLVRIDDGRILTVETPDGAWTGTATVLLRVRDPEGAEATESLLFSVIAGYEPPVAVTDDVVVLEDESVEFDPVENDISPQGRGLRVIGVSRPARGTTELLPDGRIRYTPARDFFGTDSFEYTLADNDGGLATGEARIVVQPVNDPPAPQADRIVLDEDSTATFEPLSNDIDPDGDPLELVSIGSPAQGALHAEGAGIFRFIPPPDYHGVQSFTYLVRDPSGLTATGEVAILVRPVNDPPTVRDQTVVLNRNASATIYYDAEDVDGDTLQFTILEGPAHGILFSYPTIATYDAKKGFTGEDRFTYTVSDGTTVVGPATVTLRVEDRNNPPDVKDVSTVTARDQPITIGLSATDADGEPVTLAIAREPAHGSVSLTGTNALYTPAPGFVGTDSFTYRATDGIDVSQDARVSIIVTDENTAPVAVSEVLRVARNESSPVLLKASDPENNPLRFILLTNTAYGTLEGEPPNLTYTPLTNFRGLDLFRFVATDGALTSQVAVVHLLVRDPNNIPEVTNQTVHVTRDVPATFVLQAIDPDGHPLTAAILKGPESGRVFGSGTTYTYVPRSGFVGRDSFTYKVWDGYTFSAEAAVVLRVETAEPIQPAISGVRLTDQGLELSLVGEPGVPLVVEASNDLLDWAPLVTLSNASGTVQWTDIQARDRPHRFYRIREEAATPRDASRR